MVGMDPGASEIQECNVSFNVKAKSSFCSLDLFNGSTFSIKYTLKHKVYNNTLRGFDASYTPDPSCELSKGWV